MSKLQQMLIKWSVNNELSIACEIERIREALAEGERGTLGYQLGIWALKNNATMSTVVDERICFMQIACSESDYINDHAPLIFIGDACRECWLLQKEWDAQDAIGLRVTDAAAMRLGAQWDKNKGWHLK